MKTLLVHMYLAKSKKSLGAIIATVLLLAITVTIYVNYSNWYNSYLSEKVVEYEKVEEKSIKYLSFDGLNLYVRSFSDSDIEFDEIKIEGKICNISGTILKNSITNINLGTCTQDMNIGKKDIIINSKQEVFTDDLLLSSTFNGSVKVLFHPSTTCPDISYTKLYAMDALENSHAELGSEFNYPYSVCVKSPSFKFTTSCSGTYTKLFDLYDQTNSHIYINKSDAAPSTYNWQRVCISSTNANLLNTTISTTQPSNESYCIGSLIQDDYNGGIIGDCSRYANKIWFHIE